MIDFSWFTVTSESRSFIELEIAGVIPTGTACEGYEAFLSSGLRVLSISAREFANRKWWQISGSPAARTFIVCEKLAGFDRTLLKS